MTKHSIPEPSEFVGEWFLPDNENSALLPGTLSWSSQRGHLQLHDTFTPMFGAIYGDEVTYYPAIHGTSIKGQLISILEASKAGTSWNLGPGGVRQAERINSSWIVIGAHVMMDTLFSEIQVRIPGLEVWLGKAGVQQSIIPSTESSGLNVVYSVENLPEELMEIPSISATLGWGIERNFSGNLVTDIVVKTSACLRIHTDQPQELKWFFSQLGKATTLLTFLAGSPMAPDHVSAKVAIDEAEVEILVALREAKYCTYLNPHDFYMLRNGMGIDLSLAFSKWFEMYETIAMPSQLALSVMSSENLWLHVEFLSLMQALEGFHRAIADGLYASEENYDAIKKALSNAIPKSVSEDHREALKSRIKYGNEISLRKRLDGLVSRLDLSLRKKILGGDGSVPRSWIVTRNYYTHWDEASRLSILDGTEMHRAGVRMRHLLRALYLDLVSIPQTSIEKSLDNSSSESQYLIQLNSMEHRKNNPESKSGAMMFIETKDAESPDESKA